MGKLRIMSFDLDSFTLVKSKEERSKRVIDYVRNLDIDIALLQGDENLLYDFLVRAIKMNDYNIINDYVNNLFITKQDIEYVDDFASIYSSAFVTKLDEGDIALYNIKKYKKESLWELRNKFRVYESIDYKVLAGTLQNVNIDSFCNKYNLDNICSGSRSNHILVSKGLDARVVDGPMMESVEVQPMVVDVTYKKVR